MSFKVNPRESISRCDVYENKFRSYPDEARLREARRLAASDTIDSEANKQERHLIERFRQGMFNVDTGGIRYVKQVGRFIFNTLTMPVFIAAYLIPKYAIQYALPFIADISGNFMNKLSAGSAAITAWVLSVSGIFLEAFNKYFLRKMERFQNILKSSKDFIKRWFNRKFESIKKGFNSFLSPLKRFFERQKRKSKKIFEDLSKSLLRLKRYLPAIPKFNLKFPPIKLPKFSLPRFNIANRIQAAKKLKDSAFLSALALLKKRVIIIDFFKAVGWFFVEIVKANYEIWIAPWVKRVLRLTKWFVKKGSVLKAYIQKKWGLIKKPLVVFYQTIQKSVEKIQVHVGNKAKKMALYLSLKMKKIKEKLPALPKMPAYKFPTLSIKFPTLSIKLPTLSNPIPDLLSPFKKAFKAFQRKLKSAGLYVKVFFKLLFEQIS